MLSGCPRPREMEMYNNTGKNVILITLERSIEWNANTVLKISNKKDELYWDEFAEVTTANGRIYLLFKLEVEGVKKSILLKRPYFPDGYVDTSSGASKTKIQLEKDIMFYFVPFKEVFPVEDRSQLVKLLE